MLFNTLYDNWKRIWYLRALLEAHHIPHVSMIRIISLYAIMIYGIQHCMYIYIYFPPMPTQVICRIRSPPFWAWLDCNRLLTLGRTWGVVTLSRWCVNGDRVGCNARRGLKSIFYQFYQTKVTAGIFPYKENSSYYSNWLIQTPILKRFRFQKLAGILGNLSQRFRGVIQSLQQTPREYFKKKTSRHY